MIALQVGFWLSAALLVYTYFGYPLLVVLAGRGRRPARGRQTETPSVALIIVARNEEAWIRRRLENALALGYPREQVEIVVYSDASTDRTDSIVGEFTSRGVRLLRGNVVVGQARGQAAAVDTTNAEILVFSDANTIFDRDALSHLVRAFDEPDVGCVVGSLFYRSSTGTGEGAYWRYEERLKAAEARLGTCIAGTGAIYAVRRRAYRRSDARASSDFCLPLTLAGDGWRVEYEPRARASEEAPHTVWAEIRRHARTAEGGVHCLLRVPEARRLLRPLQYPRLSWQLWSHKLLRWLTGLWLLLVCVGAPSLARYGTIYLASAGVLGAVLLFALVGAVSAAFGVPRLPTAARVAVLFFGASGAMLVGMARALAGRARASWEPER